MAGQVPGSCTRHPDTLRRQGSGFAILHSVHVPASWSCTCTSSARIRREGSKEHLPLPHAPGFDRRRPLSSSSTTFVSMVWSSTLFRSFAERASQQGYAIDKHEGQPTHALHDLSLSNGRVIGRRNTRQAFDTFMHAHPSRSEILFPSFQRRRRFASHDVHVPSLLPSRFIQSRRRSRWWIASRRNPSQEKNHIETKPIRRRARRTKSGLVCTKTGPSTNGRWMRFHRRGRKKLLET